MTISGTLLPPNSTRLERSLEGATARLGDVPAPIKELWNPATCPLELLPWLAWALSTDRWETHWTEAEKRAAVATAIEQQRKKGTPASIDQVLASFDELLKLTEWFEMSPQGEPHTFTVTLPLLLESGATGGFRTSAEFADAIIRDVIRTKPVRSHFRLLQSLEAACAVDVVAAGRTAGFIRLDTAADTTIEPEWATYLTTEIGEPIELEGGGFLEFDPPPPPFYDYALALGFAGGDYYRDGAAIAGPSSFAGYSYARTGAKAELSASGSVLAYAADVPAIVPELGYISRPSLTNAAPNSRQLENANFLFNASASPNVTAAPDGSLTADKLIADSTTNRHAAFIYHAPPAGVATRTLSAFFKAAGRTHAALGASNAGGFWSVISFDLAAGTVGAVSTAGGLPAGVGRIIALPGGWFRCIYTLTADFSNAGYLTLMSTGGGDAVFEGAAGNDVDGCFVWQGQVIDGDHADGGPIIQTGASAAAIGADDLRLDYALADSDQLIWATAELGTLDATSNRELANFTSPSGNDAVALVMQGSAAVVQVYVAGALAINQYALGQSPGRLTLVARRHAGNWRGGIVRDGVLTWLGADAAAGFPAGTTRLHVGSYYGTFQPDAAVRGIFNKLGAYDSDAKVLAAIAEHAL